MKRAFLIVLDSFGIGYLPDAYKYGDEGANTLRAISSSKYFSAPNLTRAGLFNIDGVDYLKGVENPTFSYGRCAEKSAGKDTTTGHWEIAGLSMEKPFPTFPNGFPDEIIKPFCEKIGRGILCNKPYSGTKVIEDFGRKHLLSKKPIVYTSADSVFQIAAHEDVIPREKLYEYCTIARKLLTGDFAVGRVIARPFLGKEGSFYRTDGRHDFSVPPHDITMNDNIKNAKKSVIAIGKIGDIFAMQGITKAIPTKNNDEGIRALKEIQKRDFEGLCFVNLVDFDMLYGHRNDTDGYAKAISSFDMHLKEITDNLKEDDLLIITADHGCDPSYAGTDHTREYVPLLVYGRKLKAVNLKTRDTFSDIGRTICDYLGVSPTKEGISFLSDLGG